MTRLNYSANVSSKEKASDRKHIKSKSISQPRFISLYYYIVTVRQVSRVMTKPTHFMGAQRRLRSVWASARRKLGILSSQWAHIEDWLEWADAQADRSLRWVHISIYRFWNDAAHLILISSLIYNPLTCYRTKKATSVSFINCPNFFQKMWYSRVSWSVSMTILYMSRDRGNVIVSAIDLQAAKLKMTGLASKC